MAYILNQYAQRNIEFESSNSNNNIKYMTPVKGGTVARRVQKSDNGIVSGGGLEFKDICVHLNNIFSKDLSYYFHGKIKRLQYEQKFDIKLVKFRELTSSTEPKEQYIKTIYIAPEGSNSNNWIDFEFIFTPLIDEFDCILLELKKISEDYTIKPRTPIVIFEELSIINNIIPTLSNGFGLLKIGVQTRPGLLMCINGEEIRVGRTGIYELRNGLVKIYNFGVCNTAIETAGIEDIMEELSNTPNYPPESSNDISICLFGADKLRNIDGFIVDYLYEGGAS